MAPVFAVIFVVITLFGLAWPFLHTYRMKRRRINLDKEIQIYQNRITIVTSDSISGRVTEQVLGSIMGTSHIPAANDEEQKLADREAMHSLIKQAYQMGANAIVGLNMATESFEFTDPKKFLVFPAVTWTATKVIYTGTAVKVGSPDSPGRGSI
ncbi:heavy metal-binding domain-containing protein [Candidatus Methylomirabilis sp.]|uniref:heavy metal-binding domain-containing protein n=1 Tax=Candidatus Methylomirabilis sp. TaxID=2032687 RepID=UPI003076822F